uniref:Uncharacterized protein n=1 Tax=Cucumis melo TaxID=3656 RepID=A0A9I9EDC2_CUCME
MIIEFDIVMRYIIEKLDMEMFDSSFNATPNACGFGHYIGWIMCISPILIMCGMTSTQQCVIQRICKT